MKPLLVLLFVFSSHTNAFTLDRIPFLNRDSFELVKQELKEKYGRHKQFEPLLELECLTALSFYPELSNTPIRFRFGKPAPTMVSRPRLSTFLFPGRIRSYVIIIRQPGKSHNGLDWPELSFNALVGWIGHELSHLVYYEQRSLTGMIACAMKYAIPAWRRKIERFTDFVTIRHSLGMSLFEGTDHTLNRSMASTRYKKYLSTYYLHPDEILRLDSTQMQYGLHFNHTRFRLNRARRASP